MRGKLVVTFRRWNLSGIYLVLLSLSTNPKSVSNLRICRTSCADRRSQAAKLHVCFWIPLAAALEPWLTSASRLFMRAVKTGSGRLL